ncbi:uncharacterized protein F4822DRAFT_146781 [Hypoxylon trugodes]|uniref:uncharacterized protein n=1 Tax=Hypoxylon trugodes TaxID=326681 RepID=UPI00219E4845|nr:uncharacterized protein F4822DRAFT_146781 [Hypoxylon trugodes]KAI1392953.1 hypothetical protein F4822DRAFT_146781 [Hypoxylon trugodes]
MLPTSTFSPSLSPRIAPSTFCRRCLVRYLAARRPQNRSISTSYLKKRAEADEQWKLQAQQIEEGKVPHLWDKFKERGYIKDIAGTEDQIKELMKQKRIGAYVGIDPTAPSLHVGHLLPLMPLFWMYLHGYKAISVIGGATARVGDPTDRLQSRDPLAKADMSMNVTKIHYQLKRIWLNVEAQGRRFGYEKQNRIWSRALLNNSQWYINLPFIDMCSRLFKGMRLGPMLSRETVKRRMEKGDGMSLDEFLYPLMQAWDFWHMFRILGVRMQIGGSDQYGNIISGVEAVKYIRDNEPNPSERLPDTLHNTPVGFTVPLLTDSSGAKFGKSSGNAVWLNPFMTSSFDLYGYFMRRPDADVEKLLKLFTFLPLEDIDKLVAEHNQDPRKRVAQHALAFEVVALVHTLEAAHNARDQHKGLFSKEATTRSSYPNDQPATASLASYFNVDIKLPESLIYTKPISRILYAAGLADSVTDGNRLTQHQGAYVGGDPGRSAALNRGMPEGGLTFTPVKNWFPQDTKNFLIDGKLLILRRGKHFIRVVEVVSDEEWEASGLMYPGEPGTGKLRILLDSIQRAVKEEDLDIGDAELSKKLLDRAKALYKEGGQQKAGVAQRYVQANRAGEILSQTFLNSHRNTGPSSARVKTEAIDRILEKARKEMKEELEKEGKKEKGGKGGNANRRLSSDDGDLDV